MRELELLRDGDESLSKWGDVREHGGVAVLFVQLRAGVQRCDVREFELLRDGDESLSKWGDVREHGGVAVLFVQLRAGVHGRHVF